MNFLVVLFGFLSGIFGIGIVGMLFSGDIEPIAGALIFEAIFVWAFYVCLKKYRDPEYQAKMAKSREDWKAGAPERERLRREEQDRKREANRLRTTIVSTRLIGEGAAEYKKSVGNMAFRSAVGGFFAGPAGAVLGMATSKSKNTNKDVRRFLVKYLDGHIEEKETTIGSSEYKEYMRYLEWEE